MLKSQFVNYNMTSTTDFNCVFCKESFENKEDLQIHFRKHGDPKFNQERKIKSRLQNESQESTEKRNDSVEMVVCDVCTESFPSISKAITHKHKVHPDHDAKYFCPWCGKLFTMKHLYNKHLQSSHDQMVNNESIVFHCDACDVDFLEASAMLYHNKFFHREDTDSPSIGQSKKLKIINQIAIQIFYCTFCGEEYDNKVNLNKHTSDDHGDENQSPEDVLRCPLCDAIFYHLDAYELHLTFHTVEDVYSEQNEMFEEITEFSLESVPPVMEKVESIEPRDEESGMTTMGIENLLEMALETSRDNDDNVKKSKKHKKHKKSKKSAITLDEFLNMNKDVFGEGLDIQGVEEVPSRMITKRIKRKKADMSSADNGSTIELEKLKRQGIVVKQSKNHPKINIRAKNVIPQKLLRLPNQCVSNKPISENKSPSEVLSKLLNQSNSQIKIVKKQSKNQLNTNQEDNNKTSNTTTDNISAIVTAESHKMDGLNSEPTSSKIELVQQETSNTFIYSNENTEKRAVLVEKSESPEFSNELPTLLNENQREKDDIHTNVEVSSKSNEDVSSSVQKYDNKVSYPFDDDKNDKTEDVKKDENFDVMREHFNTSENYDHLTNNIENSLDALKHLSHLITVKSLNPKESPAVINNNITHTDSDHSEPDIDSPNDEDNKYSGSDEILQSNEKRDSMKSLETLKSLNKNLTVKTVLNSPKYDFVKSNTKEGIAEVIPEKNIEELEEPAKVITTPKSSDANMSSPKHAPDLKHIDNKECNVKSNQNINLLKRLTNITAKPVGTVKSYPQTMPNKVQSNIVQAETHKTLKHKEADKQINQEIEIYNIDDSDSEEDHNSKTTEQPSCAESLSVNQSLCTTINKTENSNSVMNTKTAMHKNLQTKQTEKNVVKYQTKSQFTKSDVSEEKVYQNKTLNLKVEKTETNVQNVKVQNALKNLGKNIIIKSNASPVINFNKNEKKTQKSTDHVEGNSDNDYVSNVKITEADENDIIEEELKKNENMEMAQNVTVQYPDDSDSDGNLDNASFGSDDDFSDLESQIPKNTLSTLQGLNKNITIKSHNVNKRDNSQSNESIPSQLNANLCKKTNKQVNPESNNGSPANKRICVAQSTNQSVSQNFASNSQSSSINKEVTVKTFQTKTVIQEVTTTVTKTIKTVNQTVKQMQSTNQTSQIVKNQQIQGPRMNQQLSKVVGVPVRQATPVAGTKIRGMVPTSSQVGIRTPNQSIKVRPGLNVHRPIKPRMPVMNKVVPVAANVQKTTSVRPLKVSPNVVTVSKRQSEDNIGHFSCFKKPKESLIPVSDVPNFDSDSSQSTVQYASSLCRSNYSTTTKTVKGGNTVVSHMKSESCSQELSKLNSLSGLKVVKTSQSKQAIKLEENCEMSAAKRNTLEAIEKLQKQGLLIKKPQLEASDDCSPSDEDH